MPGRKISRVEIQTSPMSQNGSSMLVGAEQTEGLEPCLYFLPQLQVYAGPDLCYNFGVRKYHETEADGMATAEEKIRSGKGSCVNNPA